MPRTLVVTDLFSLQFVEGPLTLCLIVQISSKMSAASPPRDDDVKQEHSFVHQLAIDVSCHPVKTDFQMSRLMNTINPNDLLAQRVIDIARGNRSGDAFVKGDITSHQY